MWPAGGVGRTARFTKTGRLPLHRPEKALCGPGSSRGQRGRLQLTGAGSDGTAWAGGVMDAVAITHRGGRPLEDDRSSVGSAGRSCGQGDVAVDGRMRQSRGRRRGPLPGCSCWGHRRRPRPGPDQPRGGRGRRVVPMRASGAADAGWAAARRLRQAVAVMPAVTAATRAAVGSMPPSPSALAFAGQLRWAVPC